MPSSIPLKYVLGIDMGSGSTKAAVVSSAGEVVASAIRHTTTKIMAGGAVEQDPEEWWRSVCDAAKEAIAASRVPAQQIIAVACTTLWAVTVAVDENGAAIGNAISWMDTRGAKYNRAVSGEWPRIRGYGLFKVLKWLRFTGGAPVQSAEARGLSSVRYFAANASRSGDALNRDIAAGVQYAKNPPATPARSGAMYGGGAASLDPTMVNELMLAWLDASTEVRLCLRKIPSRVRFWGGGEHEAMNARVCGEFQFRRQLESEISRCNVAARNMTQVLRLAVEVHHSVRLA